MDEDVEKEDVKKITKADIIEAIKECLKVSPLIKPSNVLVNSVYAIVSALYLDNKKYVIIEAPTGSGKTIIGFMCYFVIQYLNNKELFGEDAVLVARPESPIPSLVYYLTSAKMLQEQIDSDLDRFDFRDYIYMLKGPDNYECPHGTSLLTKPYKYDKHGKEITKVFYPDRPCIGLKKEQREQQFGCDDICDYRIARDAAAISSCTILNYAYFLNVMRSEIRPFFNIRYLTICDEAHLLPDIVCNIFNYEFTQYLSNRLYKFIVEEVGISDKYPETNLLVKVITENFGFFKSPLSNPKRILYYYNNLRLILKSLSDLSLSLKMFEKPIKKFQEEINSFLNNEEGLVELLENRMDDVYVESIVVSENPLTFEKIYKHIIKDLSESAMVKKHFLENTDKAIFMSATLGDIDEFANMMGIEEGEYSALRLPSQFDFSKSPIFVCKSGWLNYANFDKNIDKCLMDVLKICNEFHSKEKGIIHTSTFKICNMLKDKINLGLVPDKTRFLFYQNAEEKEQMVQLMKTSIKPYVLVGPSLYEGLDLKDEQGRFNILLKTPYAGIDGYTKKKMERYPFWYKRNTLEKIVQSIGRTNRHPNDYSKVYLIDSLFDKIIFETNDSIIERIEYKTIY